MAISNLGLDIKVFAPLILGGDAVGSLTEKLTNYSHVLSADWYFKNAEISIAEDVDQMFDWLINGLGRHIEVTNQAGVDRFVGFVDEIHITAGNVNYSIGPLTELANRVLVTYTGQLILTNFISNTGQTETIFNEDEDSQDLFGIWEKVVQAGECYVDPENNFNEAEDARDLYLLSYKTPIVSIETVTGVESTTATIDITVRGYQEWLKAFIYQLRAYGAGVVPTSTTVTAIIQTILGTDINGIFSTDYSLLQACAGLQPSFRENYAYAYSVVESAVKAGDGVSRWLFQIDSQRRGVLRPVTTDIKYNFGLADNQQQFMDIEGNAVVDPWDVEPGYYYRILDTPLGMGSGSVFDPNRGFIEEINFTAPYQVSVSGEPFNKFQVYLSQLSGRSY